jgi:cell fate (sporulation/competence/biofilm development) regulator YlbF (YheA/YmcA/DUF963 family)
MPLLVLHLAVGDAMSKPINLSPELDKATDALIENLLASEPFLAYQKSRTQYKSDLHACALIERFSALQAALRRNQNYGNVTQSDIKELGVVQTEIQSNTILIEYTKNQQAAASFLLEINQEISQLLGVDFASLAKQSNCC